MKKNTKIWLIICGICFGAGLLLCVIGAAMGFRMGTFVEMAEAGRFTILDGGSLAFMNEDVYYEYDEDEGKRISDLCIELEYTNLSIEEHDKNEFIIEGTAYKGLSSDISEGKLVLKENKSKWHRFMRNSLSRNNVTLYIPKDKDFDRVSINAGAGMLKLNSLSAGVLDIEVGAGSVKAENLDVSGSTDLEVGAGNMKLEGNFQGDVTAECGVGEITMDIGGNYEDYNYEVECGIGNVSTGAESYSGLGKEKYIDNGADNTMSLKCGIGNLKVRF